MAMTGNSDGGKGGEGGGVCTVFVLSPYFVLHIQVVSVLFAYLPRRTRYAATRA